MSDEKEIFYGQTPPESSAEYRDLLDRATKRICSIYLPNGDPRPTGSTTDTADSRTKSTT